MFCVDDAFDGDRANSNPWGDNDTENVPPRNLARHVPPEKRELSCTPMQVTVRQSKPHSPHSPDERGVESAHVGSALPHDTYDIRDSQAPELGEENARQVAECPSAFDEHSDEPERDVYTEDVAVAHDDSMNEIEDTLMPDNHSLDGQNDTDHILDADGVDENDDDVGVTAGGGAVGNYAGGDAVDVSAGSGTVDVSAGCGAVDVSAGGGDVSVSAGGGDVSVSAGDGAAGVSAGGGAVDISAGGDAVGVSAYGVTGAGKYYQATVNGTPVECA